MICKFLNFPTTTLNSVQCSLSVEVHLSISVCNRFTRIMHPYFGNKLVYRYKVKMLMYRNLVAQ